MRRKSRCGRCGKQNSGGRSACVTCGGALATLRSAAGTRRTPRTAALVVALATGGILAASYSETYVLVVTDWYIDMTVAPDGVLE